MLRRRYERRAAAGPRLPLHELATALEQFRGVVDELAPVIEQLLRRFDEVLAAVDERVATLIREILTRVSPALWRDQSGNRHAENRAAHEPSHAVGCESRPFRPVSELIGHASCLRGSAIW